MSYLVGKFAAAPLGTHVEAVIIDIAANLSRTPLCSRGIHYRSRREGIIFHRVGNLWDGTTSAKLFFSALFLNADTEPSLLKYLEYLDDLWVFPLHCSAIFPSCVLFFVARLIFRAQGLTLYRGHALKNRGMLDRRK